MARQRWGIVGTGHRGIGFYVKALLKDYADRAEVVGFHDSNSLRAQKANEWLGTEIPVYESFEEMLEKSGADTLLVTSVDALHHEQIIPALERDLCVVTEKPLTTTAENCRRILEAERKSKGSLRITFNYRYAPYLAKIKELLAAEPIGKVHSVDITWLFDTVRGSRSYFRTWHRRKELSGGLLIHKVTHHFDLVAWFLNQHPVEVFATGRLVYYGPNRKERGERCMTCEYQKTCDHYIDIRQKEEYLKLYVEAESADGFFRDSCPFDPEVNIEDDISLVVTYSGGAEMHYVIRAYSPFGAIPYHIYFQGAAGRLEAGMVEGRDEKNQVINIYPLHKKPMERVLFPRRQTGTGGAASGGLWGVARGDQDLMKSIMNPDAPDPLDQRADSTAGAWSLLAGVAANESIRTGKPVRIDSLFPVEMLEG